MPSHMRATLTVVWHELRYPIAVLVLARCLTHIPLPLGVGDMTAVLSASFGADPFLVLIDLSTGGAAGRFSVVALWIYPFLLARFVCDALGPDPLGDRRAAARLLVSVATIAAVAMGAGYLYLIHRLTGALEIDRLEIGIALVTLVGGTMVLAAVLDRIGERGSDLVLSASLVAGALPYLFHEPASVVDQVARIVVPLAGCSLFAVLLRAQRRFPIQRARHQHARSVPRSSSGESTMPLPVAARSDELAAVVAVLVGIASIHAGARLLLDAGSVSQSAFLSVVLRVTDPDRGWFWIVYLVLGIAAVVLCALGRADERETSEYLKRDGSFIPGVRPGSHTEAYLLWPVLVTTWIRALTVTAILIAPPIACLAWGHPAVWPIMLIAVPYVARTCVQMNDAIRAALTSLVYEAMLQKAQR